METSDETRASMDESGWETVVDSVLANECTPFLGAGVALPHLPSGEAMALELAEEYEYPLTDTGNLPRVAQFLSTTHQSAFAKRKILEKILQRQQAFSGSDRSKVPENYSKLAGLCLPIYLTTNYDDFLVRALRASTVGPVRSEIARWHDRLVEDLGKYSAEKPTPESPLVFYLHGSVDVPSSILATEDDYIDFMVSLANRGPREIAVLPHWVRRSLGQTTLLFIGYSLNDWNFRVLMRHLMKQQNILRSDQYFSVSIQIPPHSTLISPDKRDKAKQFLSDYLGTTAISILWCTADTFLDELHRRVTAARNRIASVG